MKDLKYYLKYQASSGKLLYSGIGALIALIMLVKLFSGAKQSEALQGEIKVYATPLTAMLEKVTIRASGASKASQKLNLVSETSGQIYRLYHQKGHILNPRDTIATIQLDDRAQQLKEVRAVYNLAKEKLNVTKRLAANSFRSELNLKADEVEFESAAARLARVEKDIENTKIMAPFKGVVGDLFLEEGSVVAPGVVIATLLNLNPILIQIYISEKNYNKIKIGNKAQVTFASGEKTSGNITFLSSIADPKTHMFLAEISVENPDFKIPEGATAQVDIPTSEQKVHKINPSVLFIDQTGNMAVKIVNKENKVESYPVSLVQSLGDTIWVVGLPDEAIVINYGAHFVNVGDSVQWEPVEKLKGPESAQ